MSDLTIRTAIRHHLDHYFCTILQDEAREKDNLYHLFLSEMEETLIAEVMRYCHNNQSQSAKILGISRNTLKKKLNQYDL